MSFPRRVSVIYRKELIDILRDRRTLIAMILVPILLYPLLLLGSVQAVTFQAEALRKEAVTIGVVGEDQRRMLQQLVMKDAAAVRAAASASEALPPPSDFDAPPLASEAERLRRPSGAFSAFGVEEEASSEPLDDARTIVFDRVEDVQQAIRDRIAQVGIRFDDAPRAETDPPPRHEVFADLEDVRGRSALMRLRDVLERTRQRLIHERLDLVGVPRSVLTPFDMAVQDLSAPPSILGMVLPLVLVLMTITGAIYPAIDLTAGERERGTLETLMVCPVPVMDLIAGKFLVVTTVAIVGAALNLASVCATVYFGGFGKVLATTGGQAPLGKMALILVSLAPFAVLMSAVMIAVCAYARTFKEAQNYITPLIIAVLLPGGIAALPTTRLEGVMLVMPVGNMVLLARELLIGAAVSFRQIAAVLLSTTLYAAAAVGIASRVFGAESVVFSDVGSLRSALSRRRLTPRATPTASTSLTVVALLFPVWFFLQSAASPKPGENAIGLLRVTAVGMPLLFVIVPALVLRYLKINLATAFALRVPRWHHLLAAGLIGCTAWILAHEWMVWQEALMPLPSSIREGLIQWEEAIVELGAPTAIVLLALMPALCEELLFRGLLLGGLLGSMRPAAAVIVTSVVFGVFHFLVHKFVSAAALGLVLGYLCVRSRSIMPAVVMHFLHNALSLSTLFWPWRKTLGISADDASDHLPAWLIVAGCAALVGGMALLGRTSNEPTKGAAEAARPG